MQSFPVLFVGMLLGIKHAFDTDHILAVSTMILKHKSPYKAALIGTFWGIGHTTTLFITGLIVLILKIHIPETVNLLLEFCVGLMLVFLGIKTLFSREIIHMHQHFHHDIEHIHYHDHGKKPNNHQHHKSFLIGAVHGLAGSGALTILVLSTIRNIFEGIYYILLFGLGSVIGMTLVSTILGLPLLYSQKKLPKAEIYLKYFTGFLSIAFGLYLVYEIGFVKGLLVKL